MTTTINGTTGITFNDASVQATAATGFGFKNRIINGAMVIDQRNAGAAITAGGSALFPVDRFDCFGQVADGVFTAQQSTNAPAGFKNSLVCTVTTADSSIGSAQFYLIRQSIEGFNAADLGWGTANAQTVTLSFWVRSSLTGTFGGAIRNSAQDRSYPFTYVINAANTFEYKTVTIVGDTSGTWLTDNGIGIRLDWSLGDGSARLGTAGAWAGANYSGATGQVNLIATSGATFYITGVQLEKGSTATSFDYRPYGTELALCQRYYCQSTNLVAANALYNSADCIYMSSWNYTGGNWIGQAQPFPVSMRTTPTVSLFTAAPASSASAGNVSHYQTTWVVAGAEPHNSTNERYLTFANTGTTGVTGNCLIQFNYTASAEL
jgi:hypothetical protein